MNSKQSDVDRRQAWDLYWQANRTRSCIAVNTQAAVEDLDNQWKGFFEGLTKESTVIDIGTGNGALALVAARCSLDLDKAFHIHGVDAADINPHKHVDTDDDILSSIQFHPKTLCEHLPFDHASVDAVCGQYAIEYTNLEQTVTEIGRVLRKKAPVQFLLHAKSSVLCTRSKAQIKQAKAIFDSTIFEKLRACLPHVKAVEKARRLGHNIPSSKIELARTSFNDFRASLTALEDLFKGAQDKSLPDSLLGALTQIYEMRWRFPDSSLLEMVDNAQLRLRAQQKRLEDLEAASLNEEDMQALLTTFRDKGFIKLNFKAATAGKRNTPVGWWLCGLKR